MAALCCNGHDTSHHTQRTVCFGGQITDWRRRVKTFVVSGPLFLSVSPFLNTFYYVSDFYSRTVHMGDFKLYKSSFYTMSCIQIMGEHLTSLAFFFLIFTLFSIIKNSHWWSSTLKQRNNNKTVTNSQKKNR